MDIRFTKQTPINLGLGFDQYGPIGTLKTAVVDANGDGLQDLILTVSGDFTKGNTTPFEVKLLVSNGSTLVDGTDEYMPAGFSVLWTDRLQVADFNGDGRDDVFIPAGGSESTTPTLFGEQNRLLLAGVNGLIDATANLPQMTDFSHGGGYGDFDGDGDLDIFVNTLDEDDHIASYLMLNDGAAHFTIVDSYRSSQSDWFIEVDPNGNPTPWFQSYRADVFDINGDGYADIWTSSIDPDFVNDPTLHIRRALINDGNGHFRFSPTIGDFPAGADTDKTAADQHSPADLDHDGDIDLVLWLGPNPGQSKDVTGWQILINDGTGNFTDQTVARGIDNSRYLTKAPAQNTVVDFDGDGDLDIVAGLYPDGVAHTELEVIENKGDGTFKHVPFSTWPANFRATGFSVLDVNDDGIPDFVCDMMPHYPWTEGNHEQQFLLFMGSIDVAVNRTGWSTADAIAGGSKADTLKGAGGDDTLRGNGGSDKLKGSGGNDLLRSGSGNDSVNGGAGADHFTFDTRLGKKNVDTLEDFRHNVDVIALDHDIFTKLGASLKSGQFYAKAGATQAHDRNDRIVYDSKTGNLFYDDDGSKTDGHDPVLFATLSGRPKLDFEDFSVV